MFISGGGSGKGNAIPKPQRETSTTPSSAVDPHHHQQQQQPLSLHQQQHQQAMTSISPQIYSTFVMPPTFHPTFITQSHANIYNAIRFPLLQSSTATAAAAAAAAAAATVTPNYQFPFPNPLIQSVPHTPGFTSLNNPPPVTIVNTIAGIRTPTVTTTSTTTTPTPSTGYGDNNFITKKRKHAIAIINPITKKNVLDEIEEEIKLKINSNETNEIKTEDTEKLKCVSDSDVLAEEIFSDTTSKSDIKKEVPPNETVETPNSNVEGIESPKNEVDFTKKIVKNKLELLPIPEEPNEPKLENNVSEEVEIKHTIDIQKVEKQIQTQKNLDIAKTDEIKPKEKEILPSKIKEDKGEFKITSQVEDIKNKKCYDVNDESSKCKETVTRPQKESIQIQCSSYQNHGKQQTHENFKRKKSNGNRNRRRNRDYYASNRNFKRSPEKNPVVDANTEKNYERQNEKRIKNAESTETVTNKSDLKTSENNDNKKIENVCKGTTMTTPTMEFTQSSKKLEFENNWKGFIQNEAKSISVSASVSKEQRTTSPSKQQSQKQQQQHQQQQISENKVEKLENKDTIKQSDSKIFQYSLISYEDWQWCPTNTKGKKKYKIEQLKLIGSLPASKVKPKLNCNSSVILSHSRQSTTKLGSPNRSNEMDDSWWSNNGNNNNKQQQQQQNQQYHHQQQQQQQQLKRNYKCNVSGSGSNKNNQKSIKSDSQLMHLSLGLNQNVKLNESENAWKPSHLQSENDIPSDCREKEDILRKVRGILNKLTPEKFDTLMDEIMKLPINTAEKVNSVMILVFEKAIDEPNFSSSYARLCQRLADKNLQSDKDSPSKKSLNLLSFKTALLDKTEKEFNVNVIDLQSKETKLKPIAQQINECLDTKKKLELKSILEEEEFKFRRRSCGTVKFIGELFKMSMLTGKIIKTCINNLLDVKSEDKLECLCKLLTTVGEKYELTFNKEAGTNFSLNEVIKKMQNMVDRKEVGSEKISSRVRFMLQDVIDLRKNNWNNDKSKVITSTSTIEKNNENISKNINSDQKQQQHKDMKNEQSKMSYSNMVSLHGKKYEKQNINNSNQQQTKKRNQQNFGNNENTHNNQLKQHQQQRQCNNLNNRSNNNESWLKQTGSKNTQSVDKSKLGSIINVDDTIKLGDSSLFIWNRNETNSSSDFNDNNNSGSITLGKNFELLNNDKQKSMNRLPSSSLTTSSSILNLSSKSNAENILNKSNDKTTTTTTATSVIKSISQDNIKTNVSVKKHKSEILCNTNTNEPTITKLATVTETIKSKTLSSTSLSDVQSIENDNDDNDTILSFNHNDARDDDINSKITFDFNKILNDLIEIDKHKLNDSCIEIWNEMPKKYRNEIFSYIFFEYLHLGKIKRIHRETLSELIQFLINKNEVSINHIIYGYNEFCKIVSDILIDVPDAWQYIFEFIGLLICKKIILLKQLWNNQLRNENMGKKFLKNLILYLLNRYNNDKNLILNLWKESNLKLNDFFLCENDIENFIKENHYEFLIEKKVSIAINSGSNDDYRKMSNFNHNQGGGTMRNSKYHYSIMKNNSNGNDTTKNSGNGRNYTSENNAMRHNSNANNAAKSNGGNVNNATNGNNAMKCNGNGINSTNGNTYSDSGNGFMKINANDNHNNKKTNNNHNNGNRAENYYKNNESNHINRNEAAVVDNDSEHFFNAVKEYITSDTITLDHINYYPNSKNKIKNRIHNRTEFIQKLTKIIWEKTIKIIKKSNNKKQYCLDDNKFEIKCRPLLQRYLDSNEELEIECLNSIKLFILQNSYTFDYHGIDLLKHVFYKLWDSDIISQESFIKWHNYIEEQQKIQLQLQQQYLHYDSEYDRILRGLNTFFKDIICLVDAEEEANNI